MEHDPVLMREACRGCGYLHGKLVTQRAGDGGLHVRHRCENCGRLSSYFVPGVPFEVRETLEIAVDYGGTNPPCARCEDPLTQWHHWAPRSLFLDANEWPGAWLCRSCHARWHNVTGVAIGRFSSPP